MTEHWLYGVWNGEKECLAAGSDRLHEMLVTLAFKGRLEPHF
jgi:hypothetical protein